MLKPTNSCSAPAFRGAPAGGCKRLRPRHTASPVLACCWAGAVDLTAGLRSLENPERGRALGLDDLDGRSSGRRRGDPRGGRNGGGRGGEKDEKGTGATQAAAKEEGAAGAAGDQEKEQAAGEGAEAAAEQEAGQTEAAKPADAGAFARARGFLCLVLHGSSCLLEI